MKSGLLAAWLRTEALDTTTTRDLNSKLEINPYHQHHDFHIFDEFSMNFFEPMQLDNVNDKSRIAPAELWIAMSSSQPQQLPALQPQRAPSSPAMSRASEINWQKRPLSHHVALPRPLHPPIQFVAQQIIYASSTPSTNLPSHIHPRPWGKSGVATRTSRKCSLEHGVTTVRMGNPIHLSSSQLVRSSSL